MSGNYFYTKKLGHKWVQARTSRTTIVFNIKKIGTNRLV